jgi:hypothetical protein
MLSYHTKLTGDNSTLTSLVRVVASIRKAFILRFVKTGQMVQKLIGRNTDTHIGTRSLPHKHFLLKEVKKTIRV